MTETLIDRETYQRMQDLIEEEGPVIPLTPEQLHNRIEGVLKEAEEGRKKGFKIDPKRGPKSP